MLVHRFLRMIQYSWNRKDYFLLVKGTVKPKYLEREDGKQTPKKPFARTLFMKVIQEIKNVSLNRDKI